MTLALIWDCDGVLVDSEAHSCGAWLPVLARRGIDVDLAYIETFIGRSDGAVLEDLERRHGRTFGPDLLDEREAEYRRLAAAALQTFDGLADLLAGWRRAGRAMAVASSGRRAKIEFSLRTTGLDGCFDILCSATEVQHGKPAPDLFELAAHRLGTASADCAVIEDSVFGLQAAAAAGMRPLGFTSSHPAQTLVAAGAEATFECYDQLPGLLGGEWAVDL